MSRSINGAALALLLAAGCTMQDGGLGAQGAAATAELRDSAGTIVGSATVTPVAGGLRVDIQGRNLPPGQHGAHIHQTGLCDPPGFTTAGGHWNPTARQHGKDNPAGMHHGDLPNLTIDAGGAGALSYVVQGGALSGAADALLDADGAAIVIHAAPDDYRTDPTGNSGGRIACGVFR